MVQNQLDELDGADEPHARHSGGDLLSLRRKAVDSEEHALVGLRKGAIQGLDIRRANCAATGLALDFSSGCLTPRGSSLATMSTPWSAPGGETWVV